ncbi:MAG: phosphodiester glycosidase family protein [Clostridia bacterium]|nr:phosphodiester glycosidase family protein [Clostridia bacterium]
MKIQSLFAAALLLVMLLNTGTAETVVLPLDFSAGFAPLERGFEQDDAYTDPSISVRIETGRVFDCDYWVADIAIAHATQLRTAAANGFASRSNADGVKIAKNADAVVAVNGDFYSHTGSKYILRQGELIADTLVGKRDILLIDEDGDFHTVHDAKKNSIGDTVEGKRIINALSFGPILVEGGKAIESFTVSGIAPKEGRQRVCIAQTGPLHYKLICCAGHFRGSAGMTIVQFAQLAEQQGAVTAYNLDGGDTSMLYFHGKKLNDRAQTTRKISDIVYFASAYRPEEP